MEYISLETRNAGSLKEFTTHIKSWIPYLHYFEFILIM